MNRLFMKIRLRRLLGRDVAIDIETDGLQADAEIVCAAIAYTMVGSTAITTEFFRLDRYDRSTSRDRAAFSGILRFTLFNPDFDGRVIFHNSAFDLPRLIRCFLSETEQEDLKFSRDPTLFNYFPSKESLVFIEGNEMESELANMVLSRKKGQRILDALLEAGLKNIDSHQEGDNFKGIMTLIDRTPELSLYAKQMWLRHEKALAGAIQKEAKKKLSTPEAEAVARFILDSCYRSLGAPHPKATLRAVFKILREGWAE